LALFTRSYKCISHSNNHALTEQYKQVKATQYLLFL